MLPRDREDEIHDLSHSEALDRLDRTLEDSVRLHQHSDVPYGLFLSGGIDSSAILALMSRLNERPVRTFTVGFSNAAVHDERDHARKVAKRVGAEHLEVEFSEDDFWRFLPQVAAAVDDPTADYAILPTWKLAREAARELKVVLCGEGGDELFAGYGRYRSQLRPWWQGGRTLRSKGILDGLGLLRIEPKSWRDSLDAAQATATFPHRTRLQIAQATDCADWLPNDLLTKLDRCLMTHGLEGRTPFLDREVAKVAFSLSDEMKIKKGLGKWLLREWLERKSCLKPNLSSVNAALPSRSGNGSEEKATSWAPWSQHNLQSWKFAIPIALKKYSEAQTNAPEKPLGCCSSMRFGITD